MNDDLRDELACAGIRSPLVRAARTTATLAMCGAVVAFVSGALLSDPTITPRRPRSWTAGHAPAWAEHLFATQLPKLAALANAHDQRLASVALETSLQARRDPELAAAISELGRLLEQPVLHDVALESSADRLNNAARELGLSFFTDIRVDVSRHKSPWRAYVHLYTYHVRSVRELAVDGERFGSLWLERADRSPVLEASVGFKRSGERSGIVILDSIDVQWRNVRKRYGPWAERLERDLEQAIQTRRREGFGALDRETLLRIVLAEAVETHEIQHAIDRDRVQIPYALRLMMREYPEEAQRAAAAELSAYLAELARSEMPRLGLLELMLLANKYPRRAEGFAGRIAFHHLSHGETTDALLRLSKKELARRARDAYAALFRAPLADPSLVR